MKPSSVAVSGAGKAVCVSVIDGNGAAGDAEGLRKDMKEVRSFSAEVRNFSGGTLGGI